MPLTRDAGLAGVQPMYEQFALVLETLQTGLPSATARAWPAQATSPRRAL